MRTIAAALAAAATAAAPLREDPGWDLLVTTASRETPRTCYAAPTLPKYVLGTYLVAGPAKFEMGDYKFQAIFDGYGKMNRFELGRGEVCFTSAWMDTGYYRESVSQGRPAPTVLFEDTEPSRPRCMNPLCNMMGPNDNNWVNIIPVGGEALLLTDSPQMLSMSLDTLNCSRRKTWADDKNASYGPPLPDWLLSWHSGSTGSAHPLKIPGTQTWVEIIGEMPVFGKNWMTIYTFDGSVAGPQRRMKVGSIQTPDVQYIHSFGVTPNYVVLTFNYQMKVNPLSFNYLLGAIQGDWQGVHVMDHTGKWQVFKSDPFYHVHTVNTFENASGIVMDVGFYKELPFARTPQLDISLFLNKTARDANGVRSGVRRVHLHMTGPRKGEATFEDLLPDTRSVDFFRINPEYEGRPYCVYYATEWWHDDKSYASMAILKHNVCTGKKSYWSHRSTYVGEPLFIPRGSRGGAEDDGVVVLVALDGRSRNSQLVTLDATTMKKISVVKLTGHIPFTAHGHFIPAWQGQSAEASAATVIV